MLRRLYVRDDAFVELLLANANADEIASHLDGKTHALVRLAALIAMDAAPPSYLAAIESAERCSASSDEIVGCLIAVLPAVGVARVVSAAPKARAGARVRPRDGARVPSPRGRRRRREPSRPCGCLAAAPARAARASVDAAGSRCSTRAWLRVRPFFASCARPARFQHAETAITAPIAAKAPRDAVAASYSHQEKRCVGLRGVPVAVPPQLG